MSSSLAAPPLLGNQDPRILSRPAFTRSKWDGKATDLAKMAGLDLDPWQRTVLEGGLARRSDGRRAAFEIGLIVSRQNGKGAVLEALELAALFLLPDVKLILHSAHEFKTAAEAFLRIRALIADNPVFSNRVALIRTGAGTESIELKNGKRLRFLARTAGSGRGFSADLVILDEAFNLDDKAMAALLPTLSARPDPQVWYTSTAGEPTSIQLGRVRERGLRGDDPSLAFFEWSVDPDAYDPADPRCWAQANPGLGIRITPEHVERERAALAPDEFARERLGIGLYPTDLADAWLVIPRESWLGLADPESVARDPVAFGVEVTQVKPHGQMAAVAACGLRPDGRAHVEVIEHKPGTDWVPSLVARLVRRHRSCGVVVDPSSHAGALIEDLAATGVEVVSPFSARDAAQAFGQFRNAVADEDLVHLGQDSLTKAVAGATTRELGDALAWDRRHANIDLAPLVSSTLALWGFNKFGRSRIPHYDLLRSVG